MFGDTLLESSPASGKRKRWPIATAFTVEAIIAAIVVIIPLLSTGVIPVSARVPLFTRLNPVVVQSVPLMPVTQRSSGADGIPSRAVMIMANNNRNAIHYGQPEITTTDWRDAPPSYVGPGESHNPIGDLIGAGPATTNVKPGPRRIVSQLTESAVAEQSGADLPAHCAGDRHPGAGKAARNHRPRWIDSKFERYQWESAADSRGHGCGEPVAL
jgi:hypothetical protein